MDWICQAENNFEHLGLNKFYNPLQYCLQESFYEN